MSSTLEQPVAAAKPSPSQSARRIGLDLPTLLPFAGTLVLLTVLVWPMFVSWFGEYSKPESYYAHAPLIPFILALMFWSRRALLKAVPKAPAPAALFVLVPALALFVFASKNYAMSLMSAGFLLIVWSGLWLTLGTRFVRAFWAPLLFMTMMAPLPAPLLNDATIKLQTASTVFANHLLNLMSFHTNLVGNLIQMDDFNLSIDLPCSGFKTLLSLLTFSTAFAFLVDGTRKKRLALFLLSVPLSLLINSVRIALIGVVGECVSAAAAHVFHDWSGVITLVLGFTALFSLAKAFGCRTFVGWPIF